MTLPVLSYRDPAPAGTIPVSLDRLMVGGLLLQAASGGGKSRAIRQLLEETHGRVQHLVIDPEGEFASLRERFDYVHAAPHGAEVVATPKTARVLCRRLVEIGASAVLDIYDLKSHEKREFVRLFLDELMQLPRALWKPVLIVIDEADFFAPQHGDSVALPAIIDVGARGRKRGYRIVLTTRRISKLHKDVADLQNRMIGQTGLDVDVKRAGDELGMDTETRRTLPRLAPGSFYVYGPAISPSPILARSGEVATTHPEAGRIGKVAPPASAKVRALVAQLADLPKEAEEEAKTLDDLRRENGALKKQLRAAAQSGPVRTVEKAAPFDAAKYERDLARVVAPVKRDLATLRQKVARTVQGTAAALTKEAERLQALAVTMESGAEPGGPAARPEVGARRDVAAGVQPVARRPVVSHVGDAKVGKTGAKILGALAFYQAIGKSPTPASMVAAFVGMSASGGSWGARVSELRQAGYVITGGGTIALTDDGAAVADTRGLPTTLDELHDVWRAKLGGKSRAMLDVLIDAYPNGVTKADLAAAVDMEMAGGSFGARLSEVRAPGLLDDSAPRGEIRASAALFPEGL